MSLEWAARQLFFEYSGGVVDWETISENERDRWRKVAELASIFNWKKLGHFVK